MNYLIALLLVVNNIFSVFLLQIDVPGEKGFQFVVIGAMASSIVALVIFIRHQFKEVKDAHKYTAQKIEEIYQSQLQQYKEQQRQYAEIVTNNTKALQDNSNETRALTQTIRERLLK